MSSCKSQLRSSVKPRGGRPALKILGNELQLSHLCEWLGSICTCSLQAKHGCVEATCYMQSGHMMVSLYCSKNLALKHASSTFSQTIHQVFRSPGMRDICFKGLLMHSLVSRSIGPTISSDRYCHQKARTAYHIHNAADNDDNDDTISFVLKKDYQVCAPSLDNEVIYRRYNK